MGQLHAPASLYPWETPGTHCTGGWIGNWVPPKKNYCTSPRPLQHTPLHELTTLPIKHKRRRKRKAVFWLSYAIVHIATTLARWKRNKRKETKRKSHSRTSRKKQTQLQALFDVLPTVHLSIFVSVINQLDAQNFCFKISLFHASTCFEHMCSSSGGQNCITQPLVSSHL